MKLFSNIRSMSLGGALFLVAALLPPVAQAHYSGYPPLTVPTPTPFTQNELRDYLAGKTQFRVPFARFYVEDGPLDIPWDPHYPLDDFHSSVPPIGNWVPPIGLTQIIFYDEDGTLDVLWWDRGVRETGTWSVTSDGEVCLHIGHIEAWGELLCEAYYHTGDGVSIVYEGQTFPAPARFHGNFIRLLPIISAELLPYISTVSTDAALLPQVALAHDDGYTLRKDAVSFTQNKISNYLAGETQISGTERCLLRRGRHTRHPVGWCA